MEQQPDHEQVRAKINQQFEEGDFTGWFETLYAGAGQNLEFVPWAHATAHPLLMEWLAQSDLQGNGKQAAVVGSGLGDDAEKLSELGFDVTAFDISPSAIDWAKSRFPESDVQYHVADLFDLPADWHGQFDFVLEIFTVQALPQILRQDALKAIPPLLKAGGKLLLISFGRDDHETPQGPPWALSRQELKVLEHQGLMVENEEDFMYHGTSRRFRILYRK